MHGRFLPNGEIRTPHAPETCEPRDESSRVCQQGLQLVVGDVKVKHASRRIQGGTSLIKRDQLFRESGRIYPRKPWYLIITIYQPRTQVPRWRTHHKVREEAVYFNCCRPVHRGRGLFGVLNIGGFNFHSVKFQLRSKVTSVSSIRIYIRHEITYDHPEQ